MKKSTRLLLAIAFVLSAIVCSLVAGAYIGGRCCVPAGSGLAGGAIALGYGVLGAGIGAVIAIVLARSLPDRWLVGITLPVLPCAIVLAGITAKLILNSSEEQQAHLQSAYEKMNLFQVNLVQTDAAPQRMFERIDFDWEQRQYVLTTGQEKCTVPLTGEQAAKMLGALRGVGGVMVKDAFPCAGTLGPVQYGLEWHIQEALPPNTRSKLAITAACLEQYPQLAAPFEAAVEIDMDLATKRVCKPKDKTGQHVTQ